MSLPKYFLELKKFESNHIIQLVLKKAEQAFNSQPVDKKEINQIRSCLYKLLNEITIKRVQSKNDTWIPDFFFNRLFSQTKTIELEEQLTHTLRELFKAFPTTRAIDLNSTPQQDWFISLTGKVYGLPNLVHWIKQKRAYVYPDLSPMLDKDIEVLKKLCKSPAYDIYAHRSIAPQISNALNKTGLNIKELSGLKVAELSSEHIQVITMLRTIYAASLEQAIEQLQELNHQQVKALLQFYHKGLRGHHLRSMGNEQSPFGSDHHAVLHMMMEEMGWNAEESVKRIADCGHLEIHDVYHRGS